jgi:methionyl-tRNA formyltransferase
MDYIYVSNRPWAINTFLEARSCLEGNWLLVTSTDDLLRAVTVIKPKYIFFPHWSELVPAGLTETYECVCFHMTDLPFGRGGSPLQNLIKRGVKVTKLTALKMEEKMDAGPIYKKDELNLDGSAEQIFIRMTKLAITQIQYIIKNNPTPISQPDEKHENFKRRRCADSEIKEEQSIEELFDHIRMLDAPGYPKAFLGKNSLNYEFSNASVIEDGKVLEANVKITKLRIS